jgi:hypothetical protein
VTIKEFICPGEKHAISRSVHLARMAAYYPKCGDCPFRGETGQLAPVLSGRRAAGSRQHRRSLVAADGLRGIFINELGRGEAFALTAAFASLLWERRGRIGEDSGDSNFFARNYHEFRDQTRPTVVVGYDQRPSSPELMAGVLDGLRQTGCGIVDAGAATAPYLWWNVARSGATGGILITGAGCDPSWSGMDFVGPGSVPISSGEATQVGGRRSEVGGRKSEVRGRRSEVGGIDTRLSAFPLTPVPHSPDHPTIPTANAIHKNKLDWA